jgi:imidazolonepropionase-like amidohydrolase
MSSKVYSILIIILLSTVTWGQKDRKILLVNGFLHVGNGDVIPNALVGIQNDQLILVRNSLAYTYNATDWDTIIQLKGKHIYPGFIAPNSTLGLTEIDAVRATRDYDEVGLYNPHVRSQTAFNVESNVIATVKTNGVLLVQSTPRGGIISGSSSILHMDGWNWEDATVLSDDGIHVNWPNSLQNTEPKEDLQGKKRSEKYVEQKRDIHQFFDIARVYSTSEKRDIPDLRFEAMKLCFTGTKRVYFHANELQQLVDIIDFAKAVGIAYPVIVGGYDSHLIASRLKDASIPVMLIRPHSLPEHEADAVDLPYRLPALLQEKGVKFCLQNEGDMEAMNARNLPFLAGTAKAYGLTEEQAIQAITLSSCQIMGIDQWYGSIQEGKKATLFVSTGNALDMRTNNVVLAFMNGRIISLDNAQKALYRKYSEKYAH